MKSDRESLAAGIGALGLPIEATAQATLLAYRDLLQKWNRHFNLTAVRDPEAMVLLHLLDSLALLPWVPSTPGLRMVDIGSGGGLPGIPIAIVRPGQKFCLLDSSQKKASFLRQAVLELPLPNATVACVRAEAYQPDSLFDVAVSRAFSELADYVAIARPLVRPGGKILAMKGTAPDAQIAALPRGLHVSVHTLAVPGLDANRCVVIVENADDA